MDKLTVKENEVYQKLLQGLSSDEIAKLQDVKLSTIKTQIYLILQKIGVSHRYELMALEIERLRTTLQEIKKVASIDATNTCWSILHKCDVCTEAKECGLQSPLEKLKNIFVLITKAESEG